MYRGVDLWEDAYRVAQTNGGPNAAKQVAFLWAKTLGGESAVKLLSKFNILEQGIDYACESYQFEFAFELAKLAAKDKMGDIHCKYAMALGKEKHALKIYDCFQKNTYLLAVFLLCNGFSNGLPQLKNT